MTDKPNLAKRLEHTLVGLLTPGATYRRAKMAFARSRDAATDIAELRSRVAAVEAASRPVAQEALDAHRDETARRLNVQDEEDAATRRALADLSRRVDILRHGSGEPAPDPSDPSGGSPSSEGLDALLDAVAARLEARQAGGREAGMRRLRPHLPDAELALATTGRPALDLGCGRGEWLELLAARGHAATGVDANPVQVADAREAGFDVTKADALAHLSAQADGSLGLITAFGLLEHLPFRHAAALVREAMAKLTPGGLLLVVTPNPANLVVGAADFHLVPGRHAPLPADLLKALLDTVGFHPVEMRARHPDPRRAVFSQGARLDPEVAEMLFGPQDTVALATKPAL